METVELGKEQKTLLGLKITNVIMIFVTAAMIALAVYYLMMEALPFGMTVKKETSSIIIDVGLVVMAVLALAQTVLGFMGAKNRKICRPCSYVGYILAVIFAGLYYFAIGMDGMEWLVFAGLIACPFINANFADRLAKNAEKSSE